MTGAIYYFILLLVAEIIASAALWHGTPTDWTSGPLRFWVFEGMRLRYWAGFCLLLSALGGVGWIEYFWPVELVESGVQAFDEVQLVATMLSDEQFPNSL